jgi:RNA polymerase sigma factor (sigma-70 family)
MTRSADLEELLAHADWLRALASRLVGRDAEDAVQETLIAAIQSPPDADRPAKPWLAQVLRNVTRMQFRGATRRAAREQAAELPAAPAAGPQEIVERVELRRMLCEHVLALDEPYRRTLVMHYFDGIALADIARTDGVPEGTVRGRHREALARMRSLLDAKSNGDRKAWMASLAPFAIPAKSATAALAGGLIVKKLAVAVVVAIVAALVVWKVTARDPVAASPPPAPPSAHVVFGQHAPRLGGGASLHGRVTSRATLVLIETSAAPLVVARQEGETFDFPALAAGRYCIVATAGPLSARACNLVLARDAATLHGLVADADGGAVARPTILAQRYPQVGMVSATEGDDTGHYELALAPGWYRITIQAAGYTAARQYLEVVGRKQLDAKLNAASVIAGIVVDENHVPVPHASVSTLDWSSASHTAQTGADGRFTLDGLRPGTFDIVASADDRASAPTSITVAFGATRELELVVQPSKATLAGRVVDDTERPVANCLVTIRGAVTRSATTDAAGSFRVAGLVSGVYEVAASADGFVRASAARIVASESESQITLRVARGVMITGTVRTSRGEPVADAAVSSSAANLDDPRLDIKTDARGAFTLGPLPPGETFVSAFHAAHGVTEVAKLAIPIGTSPRADLVFGASASVEGTVTYEGGAPARGAFIEVTHDDAPARWAIVADDNGRFVLDSLPAGSFSVAARPPVEAPLHTIMNRGSWRQVEVKAHVTAQVSLVIAGGNERITGRVVDAQGAAVEGAAVWVEREAGIMTGPLDPDEVRSYSWSDGSFHLDDLPRGSYTVYATHPERGTGSIANITAGSTTTLTLAASATLSGRVVDAAGKPVRAFRLEWMWKSRSSPSGGYATSRAGRMFESADGTFTIANLTPTSDLTLSAETARGASGELAAVALTPNQHVSNREIRVVEMGLVRGRLITADGAAAIGMSVFFPTSSFQGSAAVDGTGRFETRLPAGTYQHINVQSQTQGYAPIARTFEVKPNATIELGDVAMSPSR